MTIADLEALYTAFSAARNAGNYDAAIGCLMDMKARLASTPNLSRALGGGGQQAISWNPSQLDSLIADCRKMKAAASHAASGPFVTVPVTYQRPDSTGGYV